VNIENIVPTIIPRLFVKPTASRAQAPRENDAQAIELARLLIAPDPDDAFDVIEQRLAREKAPSFCPPLVKASP
jgi:hypothetical protein